jgi:hypothetical protein
MLPRGYVALALVAMGLLASVTVRAAGDVRSWFESTTQQL